MRNGSPVTQDAVDALCDYFRADTTVECPLRPTVHEETPELAMRTSEGAPTPPRCLFTWGYLELPIPWTDGSGQDLASFPLAVASLAEPHHSLNARHLLNAHSLCELLPQSAPASKLFGFKNEDFALFRDSLAVQAEEVVHSNVAVTWQRKSNPEYQGHPSGLHFNRYMASVKSVLAALAFWAKNASQSRSMQEATYSILERFLQLCGDFTLLPGSLEVQAGLVEADTVLALITDVGALEFWEKAAVVKLPRIDQGGSIPAAWPVFFAFRQCHCARAPLLLQFAKAIVHTIGDRVDATLSHHLHTRVPTCKLPKDCVEIDRAIRLALKGDDKRHFVFSRSEFFLRRNMGKGPIVRPPGSRPPGQGERPGTKVRPVHTWVCSSDTSVQSMGNR